MPTEPANFDVQDAGKCETDDNVSPAIQFTMDSAESIPPAYDLAEIGVDEMEPPSPTAQAALEPPRIEPPVIRGPTEEYATPSRSSPPPSDGAFPLRGSPASRSARPTSTTPSTPQPETRARAEEINSGSKIVPKIEASSPDFMGVYLEVESWFSTYDGDAVAWLAQNEDHTGAMSLLRQCLSPSPEKGYQSTSELLKDTTSSTLAVLAEDHTLDFVGALLPTTDFAALTLLYVLLVVHVSEQRRPLLARGVPLISTLMNQLASLRWSIDFDDSTADSEALLSRLFMLCRMSIMATFGNESTFKEVTADIWKRHGLDPPAEGQETDYASPLSYASYLQSITKRFPTFIPPEDQEDSRAYHRHMDVRYNQTPDPHDPRELVSSGAEVVPYVPQSIIEACQLFKSRVKATPQILQMWEEQERAQHVVVPPSDGRNAYNETAEAVKELYASVMRVQKSFVQVVVEFCMQLGASVPTPGIHAALSTVWMLLKWYDLAHVLMGEYLGALLFDCQFHLMAHSFCRLHTSIAKVLLEPYSQAGFWTGMAGPVAVDDSAPSTPDRSTQLLIEHFNKYNLKTYVHVVGIVRLMILNKTQRTLVVAELPVDPLKALFGVYEKELWNQVLQLLKLEVPFNGKRWRYLNMEIISAIYLYCPSKLDDDWLSGADVSQDVKDAPAQEHMLRALIERFNERLST